MDTMLRSKIQFQNSKIWQDTAYNYKAHLHIAKFYLNGTNPSHENDHDYIKQHRPVV